MAKLLKVNLNENHEQVISGRMLHEFLEVKARYNDWFPRMCEYGFSVNTDFTTITQKRVTAQGNETTYTDHVLKLDMAKEISMLQRTEKGKQARQYFIEIEKKFRAESKYWGLVNVVETPSINEFSNNSRQSGGREFAAGGRKFREAS